MRRRRLKFAFYSHDTMGLGHLRRNLLLAQALADEYQSAILVIAGVREATAFTVPPGADCLTLPALWKDAEGAYRARSLDVSLEELTRLRSQIIASALDAFRPDVFIVDNVPSGASGELLPTLHALRRTDTRCVLGLRDVLDEPSAVRAEWARTNSDRIVGRYYDAVWVYGDPAVYDVVAEYPFLRHVARQLRYTGYLNQRARLAEVAIRDEAFVATGPQACGSDRVVPTPYVLCSVGGGQDGAALAEAFARARASDATTRVLLTGPYMPSENRQHLESMADGDDSLELLPFVREPAWLLRDAERVVSMGGYNTTCEILSFRKRALIVPRTSPRREQYLRAERLQRLGLVDLLDPTEVDPERISDWLAAPIRRAWPDQPVVDMDGLLHVPALVDEVLAGGRSWRSVAAR